MDMEQLSLISERWIWFCVYMKVNWDTHLTVVYLLLAMLWRVVVENKFSVRRRSSMNWGIFGASITLIILSKLLVVASITMYIRIFVLMLLVVSYFLIGRGNIAQVMESISGTKLVHESPSSGPSRAAVLWSGKKEAIQKWESDQSKPISVKHHWQPNRGAIISGIPCGSHVFKWVASITANKESFYRLQGQMERYFTDYSWMLIQNGKWTLLTAYPKGSKSTIYTGFDSSDLPWYVVPMGAQNTAKRDMFRTSYFWKLHDTPEGWKPPKALESNELLKKARSAPMALVCGGTGGGKSVLLKNVISHMVSHGVELYLSDPKGGAEFGLFATLPEVKAVATTMPETYEIFKQFLYSMSQRYQAMARLGVNHIPLDGDVELHGKVLVNGGFVLDEQEWVHCRSENGSERDVRALDLSIGYECVMLGNKDLRIPSHWEFIESIQIGQNAHFTPMLFISDEYAQLVSSTEREDQAMLAEIKNAVETVARLGRAANVHLIVASQSATNNLFPPSLKNNLQFRTICGAVTQDISRMIIGSEEGESIPCDPMGMYLSWCKGEVEVYQGTFVDQRKVLMSSSLSKKVKNVKSWKSMSIPRKVPKLPSMARYEEKQKEKDHDEYKNEGTIDVSVKESPMRTLSKTEEDEVPGKPKRIRLNPPKVEVEGEQIRSSSGFTILR